MAIVLPTESLQKIETHGCEAYPDECCGIILGSEENDRKLIVDVLPVKNSRETNQLSDGAPAELVAMLKDAFRLLHRTESKSPAINDWLERAEPMVNSSRNRFRIDQKDFLRCDEEATKRGLKILGFYHSHPDHPPTPSEYDRQNLLNPWYTTYLILGVERGVPKKMAGWAPSEDGLHFVSEEVVTAAEAKA